jgi:predicted anti-sigma-YlaC factor YlaD
MRCSNAHKLIGDRLDGTLSPEDDAELREHLDGCGDCRELMKDFEGLVEQARQLPKLEPSDRAWPMILRRVREAGREEAASRAGRRPWAAAFFAPGRLRYAAAAALILLAAISAMVSLRPGKSAPAMGGQDRYTLAKLDEAEKYYKLAIQALTAAVNTQKNGLDPQVAVVVARNLREIDAAIQDCQNAVKNNPGNLQARIYLLGAYKDKVAFLDNIIDVKKNNPSVKGTKTTI